jgi:hypothetical protein
MRHVISRAIHTPRVGGNTVDAAAHAASWWIRRMRISGRKFDKHVHGQLDSVEVFRSHLIEYIEERLELERDRGEWLMSNDLETNPTLMRLADKSGLHHVHWPRSTALWAVYSEGVVCIEVRVEGMDTTRRVLYYRTIDA